MSTAALISLFAYHAWANAELCETLAQLPAQHAEQSRSCVRTLNHIYVVERIFRAHLSAEAHPFTATNTPETPSLAQLQRDLAETDGWYQAYLARLNDAERAVALEFTFTDGDRGRMSREEMLLHVVTHSGYHRGNIGQTLKSIGFAPPRDLFTKYLHLSEPQRRASA